MKDNEIMPSSLSILTVEERQELIKKRISEEIDLYIKKTNISELKLSKLVGVNHRTIYSWREKKIDTQPKREKIISLANILKINPLYLLAESNRRLSDNEQIELEELVQDSGLLGLQRLKKEFEFSKESNDYITYIDLKYIDIISSVISNIDFWKTLIHEASRLISLQTIHYKQAQFEDVINKEDIVDNPTKIDYIELSHFINSKALNKIFDKYINDKKKELEIVEQYYEEKMSTKFIIPD